MTRATLVALAASLVAFAATGFALHHGFYASREISDLPDYRVFGAAVADGQMPYRDFPLEYPPGALPAFVLPEILPAGGTDGYRYVFERLMWVCGGLVLFGMAVALRALDGSRRHVWAALGFAALAPLALGTVYLLRFDLWPAALMALALAALVAGRHRSGCALLGLGTAVKVYPAVALPLALVYVSRRLGRREAARCSVAFLAALAVVVLPFVALAPDGIRASTERQLERPLQLESLGGAMLTVLHHVGGFELTVAKAAGSDNLTGGTANLLGTLHGVVQAGALAALWIAFARGPSTPERLVRYTAATVAAYVAFGKVLSPQYLVWLVPIVPLVAGRRGAVASALLGALLVTTQLWFPFRYWELRDLQDVFAAALVLTRDIGLVALLAVLVAPLSRADRPSEPIARSAPSPHRT